jgi:hypothetical protein
MGFLPDTFFNRTPETPHDCAFCARGFPELYMLPSFGLAGASQSITLACGECYQQITFTSSRPASRIVRTYTGVVR